MERVQYFKHDLDLSAEENFQKYQ